MNFWHRTTHAALDRFRGGALASYGAGLHGECDDCAVGPTDHAVPAQRRQTADEAAASRSTAEAC